MTDLRALANVLGGEIAGAQVLAPGPGHGPRDRSLSVKLSATAPDGFLVFSHAGDDWRECRDYVRAALGLRREPREPPACASQGASPAPPAEDERAKSLWLWRSRRPIAGTGAEVYLRQARGYGGAIPPTLAFLPARGEHPPALIAAFGIATEPEPGELAIDDDAVRAVQLTRLKPDGSGKADCDPSKIIIGKGALGSPIVVAPPNDLFGLAICEGLEDALSIHEATGLGAWAAGGATRLPALADAVPDYIDCVNIFRDDDEAGRRGAKELAGRLFDRGFREPDRVIVKSLSRGSSS
jgi:hypothetical protein